MFSRTNHPRNEKARYQARREFVGGAAHFLRAISFCTIIFATNSAFSQELDSEFVDAFAPIDASAAAFHNHKFHEAEKALLNGLSRNDHADQNLGGERPTLRNVSTTSKPRPKQELSDASEPLSHSQRPDLAEHNSYADRHKRVELTPAMENIANDLKIEQTAKSQRRSHRNQMIDSKQERDAQTQEAHKKLQAEDESRRTSQNEGNTSITENDLATQKLKRELADAKSALAAAELEISRLSSIIQGASRARLHLGETATTLGKTPQKMGNYALGLKNASGTEMSEQPQNSAPTSDPSGDLQVATISVDKADLRLGPGRNHSALMSLRRGSRLAVEARQGEWYRVFAPNGQRAWIHSSLVRFGDGAASLNDNSSVKVRGYDSKLQ